MNLPDGVSRIQLGENIPALQIKTPDCSATLSLQGAHLTHWQPSHTNHPVLYTSPTALYQTGKAIRGGIPLCWPWFNAHPTAPTQHPSHGVARNQLWSLDSAIQEGPKILLKLSLTPNETITSHVPFPFQLTANFVIGKFLFVYLTTKNLSDHPVPIGGALHTYLALSDISKVHLTGLQNTPYIDTTTSPESHQIQAEELLAISKETDRIYYGTSNDIALHDPDWNRLIQVSKIDSLTTVLWNPWSEKAADLSDLPDQDFRKFLCIEAANARHDTRILPAGKSHRLTTILNVL